MAKALTQAGPMLPGLLPAADQVKAILRSIRVDMEGRQPVVSRFPLPDERRALQERNVALFRALEPANMKSADLDEAKAELARLFLGFPQLSRADASDLCAAYVLVLQKYPLFAIRDACADVANGRVKNQDDRYPPTSPQVSKAAAISVERVARERIDIERILQARTLLRPADDEGSRGRVAASLKDFHGRMPAPEGLSLDERKAISDRRRAEDEAFVLREWAALGIAPMRRSDNTVISVSLAKTIGRLVEVSDGRNGKRLMTREEAMHEGNPEG